MKKLFGTLAAFILLTACTTAPIDDSSTSSSSAVSSVTATGNEHGPLFLIEIPAIGMMFPYWEELIVTPNVIYDEDISPERKGEYGSDLKGKTVTAFLSVINYDRPSSGLGDWSITGSVPDALSKNIHETSCDLLKDKDIYLPVDMNSPHTCEASITLNGQTPFIIASGKSDLMNTPSDMVILFQKDRAVILSGLTQLPSDESGSNMGLLMSIGRGVIFE